MRLRDTVLGALGLFGVPKQEWLSGQATALPTIVGVDVWHETSLMIVIILAGLIGVFFLS